MRGENFKCREAEPGLLLLILADCYEAQGVTNTAEHQRRAKRQEQLKAELIKNGKDTHPLSLGLVAALR